MAALDKQAAGYGRPGGALVSPSPPGTRSQPAGGPGCARGQAGRQAGRQAGQQAGRRAPGAHHQPLGVHPLLQVPVHVHLAAALLANEVAQQLLLAAGLEPRRTHPARGAVALACTRTGQHAGGGRPCILLVPVLRGPPANSSDAASERRLLPQHPDQGSPSGQPGCPGTLAAGPARPPGCPNPLPCPARPGRSPAQVARRTDGLDSEEHLAAAALPVAAAVQDTLHLE